MSTENNEVYDLSESRQGNIIACAVLTWVISAFVVASRLYLRGHLMKLLGPEDWVILAALFFSLAQSIGFTVMASLGLGKHFVAIPPENFVHMLEVRLLLNAIHRVHGISAMLTIHCHRHHGLQSFSTHVACLCRKSASCCCTCGH